MSDQREIAALQAAQAAAAAAHYASMAAQAAAHAAHCAAVAAGSDPGMGGGFGAAPTQASAGPAFPHTHSHMHAMTGFPTIW